MTNEKLLIDANDVYALFAQNGMARLHVADIDAIPRVDAYTEEQVAQIIKQAGKLAAKANELEKEVVWLKSCLNCKIRKECPSHCGKVVHNCDHWEYGDNAVEVVHAEWTLVIDENDCECIECPLCGEQFYDGDNDTFDKPWNYCPNCGTKMDGDGNA